MFGDIDGGPKGDGKPFSARVSASRHGDSATNGTGVAATSVAASDFCATLPSTRSSAEAAATGGCQYGGADQFRIG